MWLGVSTCVDVHDVAGASATAWLETTGGGLAFAGLALPVNQKPFDQKPFPRRPMAR